MTKRKKKILLIQSSIFFLAILLIYFTYYHNNTKTGSKPSKEDVTAEKKAGVKKNTFENIEYSGIDLNGNRYIVKSENAEFKIEKPELIDMKKVNANFYFKDGTELNVLSDYGTYNNKNFNITFRKNVKSTYNESYLYSDYLNYINTESTITIYGNITGESIQGDIAADKINIDISAKTLDVSMFDKEQIDLLIRNNKWEKVLE